MRARKLSSPAPSSRSRTRSSDRRHRALIYSGAYSTCEVPGYRGRCVRVVFPLPNGNAIVIMRPVSDADGSLALQSVGRGFGSPGFYFTVHGRDGIVWARYLKSFRETIRVRH